MSFKIFAKTNILGKDIEIALTEIRELQNNIDNLEVEEKAKQMLIQTLRLEREELQRWGGIYFSGYDSSYFMFCIYRDLSQYQKPPPSLEPQVSSFCSTNKCYTPTEFALFGLGTVVMGVLLGVLTISWFKQVGLIILYIHFLFCFIILVFAK